MKKRTVISNVPVKLPLQSTILYSFLLYYFHASGVLWGIFITLYAIYWLISIISLFNQDVVDLDSDKFSLSKIRFANKLRQILKDNEIKNKTEEKTE